ncbi:accessory gene regulator ArgB-like protein [Tissierella pigra]|uniref:Accessory regulator AgrB n=2 Tax=Tissierella pigra TaxID=2607614 RepID=A0A6N7XUL1_9FIRM|nr:accessory gene regulator B family protein [Tissierella pigra]MSU01477.1 accessory regulator AgrB [Tissierella pigra]
MENNMIEKITNYFVVNELIKDEDKEIYAYGLHQGLLILINIITTILIGFIFKAVWESILFIIVYTPLRAYGGGYHAKTEVKCYLFSIALILVVLLGIKIIPDTDLIILALTEVGGIIIWFLAPVEDSNKPLDKEERIIYKKRTGIILTTEIIITISLLVLNFKEIALVMAISIFVVSLMLVLGKKVNKD